MTTLAICWDAISNLPIKVSRRRGIRRPQVDADPQPHTPPRPTHTLLQYVTLYFSSGAPYSVYLGFYLWRGKKKKKWRRTVCFTGINIYFCHYLFQETWINSLPWCLLVFYLWNFETTDACKLIISLKLSIFHILYRWIRNTFKGNSSRITSFILRLVGVCGHINPCRLFNAKLFL